MLNSPLTLSAPQIEQVFSRSLASAQSHTNALRETKGHEKSFIGIGSFCFGAHPGQVPFHQMIVPCCLP